jgi:cytidylate kinase
MCVIIAISGDDFSGVETLAAGLSERLGFRRVDNASLVERASTWAGDRGLRGAPFESFPEVMEQRTHNGREQLCVLRAMVAEEVRHGNVVCQDAACDLLMLQAANVVRIRVEAPYASRLRAVEEAWGVPPGEAHRRLEECDCRMRRWREHLYGSGESGSPATDLVINVQQTSIESACGTVREIIEYRSMAAEAAETALANYELATRVKAELSVNPATSHLELEVIADNGAIALRGNAQSVYGLGALLSATLAIPGVDGVDLCQVRVDAREQAAASANRGRLRRRSPAIALVAAGGVLVLALALAGSWLWRRGAGPAPPALRNFAGTITDTLCIGGHKPTASEASCVRACVRRPGVKYALYDGARAYVLNDQPAAEPFAAQRVVVTGFVEPGTGNLQVDSIRVRR